MMKRAKFKYMIRIISVLILIFSIILSIQVSSVNQKYMGLNPPSWKGIVPGVTDREMVTTLLGEPDQVKHFWFYKEILRYKINGKYDQSFAYHEIQIEFGTVSLIIEQIVGVKKDIDPLPPEHIFNEMGEPEKITWSQEGGLARAVFYCNQGKIIHTDYYKVIKIMYFKPIQLSDCLWQFREYIYESDQPREGDIFGPIDPWGITNE